MNYKIIKQTRVTVALFFIVLITLPFIFFINRETTFFSYFLKLQFIPSLIAVFTGGAFIFLLLLLITLLFGRIYCSVLCPLGIFQDIVARVSNLFKSKKRRRFKYGRPWNILRYTILAVTVFLFIGGISLPLGYLDPYSNWGRISTEIIGRVEHLCHNIFALILPNAISYRSYTYFLLGAFLFPFLFALLVVILSAFRGRLYCNTVCPVGSLLGLISKISFFQPVINKTKCNKCQLCVINCKSQCIDLEKGVVDVSRCVTCFNCMQVCNKGAMEYKFLVRSKRTGTSSELPKEQIIFSNDRRKALIAMGALGTAIVAKSMEHETPVKTKSKTTGITPPGAVSIERFKKNCTACYACVSACPSNIIKPAYTEYGLDGLLLPVLNFSNHYCSYDCKVCTEVCPNDALLPLTLKDKQLTQIGQVRYTPKNCIVYTDGVDCGACDEHCPTKAITMIPFKNSSLYIPKVNYDLCIGCGACEHVCPARPDKAMVIHALEKHGIALLPEKEQQKKIDIDDFGF